MQKDREVGMGDDRRRRQTRFLIKTDHSQQLQENLIACLHRTKQQDPFTDMALYYVKATPRSFVTGLLQNRKVEIVRTR